MLHLRRAGPLCCLLPLALIGAAEATAPARPTATPPDSAPATSEEPQHWAQILGVRVATDESRTPLVDQVVLVPDAATYLDELSRWTPAGHWPVLFESHRHTAIFVRTFTPARLLRRESVGAAAPKADALRQMIETIVRASWGLATEGELAGLLQSPSRAPAGLVVASTSDPAWTAAVALAAGRGQPIAWLDEKFGGPNDTLDDDKALALQRAVNRLLDSTGITWRGLGDAIETVTICRAIAGRAALRSTASAEAYRGSPGKDGTTIVAAADLLGRLQDGSRGAFAGVIFGDEPTAAYMAMSSLFLPRRDILMFSGYGDEEPWRRFDPRSAQTLFEEAGFTTRVIRGDEASATNWRSTLDRGWSSDIALANSSGNADFMTVAGGKQIRAGEIPVLERPMALNLVHSWSLRAPSRSTTIGGRFLAHGVYVYSGSVEEPFLHAFMPPIVMAQRLRATVPFLVAARHWDGPLSAAWRITTLGDPLMIAPPPADDLRRRLAPPDPPAKGFTDVRAWLKEALRRGAAGETADAAGSLRALEMLTEDALARSYVGNLPAEVLADQAVARAILPLAFRRGDALGFLAAWRAARSEDLVDADMFWHLVPARLPQNALAEAIPDMERAIRGPARDLDAARLHGIIDSLRGPADARSFFDRMLLTMPDEPSKKRFRDGCGRRI